MSETKLRERAEIPVEHTWSTETIYPSSEAWDAAVAGIGRLVERAAAFQGRLAEGPAVLADWLDLYQELGQDAQRVAMWAFLVYSVDTNDPAAGARLNRVASVGGQVAAATAFAEPEIVALGAGKLAQWAEQEPRLEQYRHYFQRVQDKAAHLRSAEVEELLGAVQDPFSAASQTHGILTNSELPFAPAHTAQDEPVEIGQGNIGALITHADREVRRTAWESYADAHLAYKKTMANCLLAGVKQNVFMAKARRYDSALDAALASEQIPAAVFHNLIDTYKKNLPTWHRYWRVRRKALGLDELHEYDIKAPLTSQAPTVSYSQAVDWIVEGMRPLGEEYVSVLRRGATEERWVDIYPNKGKRAGAFSYGGPGTHPFIMMSFTDDLFSMSTLAHELGHSLHSYYTWNTQPLIYADYSLFVAEVASNFNQAMVRAHIFETQTDRDLQIAVIEEAMSNFHRYFFIMPTLARFELEVHQRVERGEALNADDLNELMADLFAEGYGGEVALDRARTGITWAEFSTHLYSNFYVYQYATGISAAHALSGDILEGKQGAVERYLDLLRAGGSLYALDALRRAGVDMASPEPVERTFAVLARLVERLEALFE